MAAAVTRFIIGAADPVSIAVFRFGLGFIFLLPVALALRSRWPQAATGSASRRAARSRFLRSRS